MVPPTLVQLLVPRALVQLFVLWWCGDPRDLQSFPTGRASGLTDDRHKALLRAAAHALSALSA